MPAAAIILYSNLSLCTFAGWHSSCCLELELPWSIISIADQSARVPRHHQPQSARRPQWGETGPKWGSNICDQKWKCKLVIPASSVFNFVRMFACRYIAHNLYKHSQAYLHVCYGHLSLNDCLLQCVQPLNNYCSWLSLLRIQHTGVRCFVYPKKWDNRSDLFSRWSCMRDCYCKINQVASIIYTVHTWQSELIINPSSSPRTSLMTILLMCITSLSTFVRLSITLMWGQVLSVTMHIWMYDSAGEAQSLQHGQWGELIFTIPRMWPILSGDLEENLLSLRCTTIIHNKSQVWYCVM